RNYSCELFDVSLNVDVDSNRCVSTFCYTISDPLGIFDLDHFDLLGVHYDLNSFSSNATFWEHLSFGQLRNKLGKKAGITQRFCFTVYGKVLLNPSTIILNFGHFSCEKPINVPGVSTICDNDCVVDTNFGNAECQGCPARCFSGQGPSAIGTETCTLKIRSPAIGQGKPCNLITSRLCTKPCPVDCQYSGPVWKRCSANCETPTLPVTGYFLVTPEINGGLPCTLTATTTTSICSLPSSVFLSKCPIDCKYTGIPTVSCAALCSPGDLGRQTTTYSYPITLSPSTLGGSTCPTPTTTCTCCDCILSPTPTSKSPCDAVCSKDDGSYATGYETYFFPISRTASPTGKCITESTRTCSKSCPCKFTASSSIGKCIPTSTITSTYPWVITGFQEWTAVGPNCECNTIVDVPCSTIAKPVDCTIYSECAGCNCQYNTNLPYSLTETQSCRYTTLQPAFYGGKPCPTQPPSKLCTTTCPGCEYLPQVCDCEYTISQPPESGSQEFSGTKTCQLELKTPPGYRSDLECLKGSSSCELTKTLQFPASLCSTKIGTTDCLYKLYDCKGLPTYTSTATSQLPWTVFGFDLCTLSDSRPSLSRPRNCSTTISTFPVTTTLKPQDCTSTNLCFSSQPVCSRFPDGTINVTQTCSPVTIREPNYGGRKCSPATTSTIVTKTTCTRSSPTTTTCFDMASEFNAVFFGSVNVTRTFFEGRVAILNDAFLLSVDIGLMISFPLFLCDLYPSNALLVGGDLVHFGKVYNGDVKVYGGCGNGTVTDCKIFCNEKKCLCGPNGFDFVTFNTEIISYQQILASMTTTVLMSVSTTGENTLTWSGNQTEVINIYSDPTGHLLNLPYFFNSTLNPSATIIFNILGSHPAIEKFNFPFSRDYASNIIYNFVEATDITFLDSHVKNKVN
ncbi:hypothetical protein HMI54_004028, partial [Coelomomyces lativittatus]